MKGNKVASLALVLLCSVVAWASPAFGFADPTATVFTEDESDTYKALVTAPQGYSVTDIVAVEAQEHGVAVLYYTDEPALHLSIFDGNAAQTADMYLGTSLSNVSAFVLASNGTVYLAGGSCTTSRRSGTTCAPAVQALSAARMRFGRKGVAALPVGSGATISVVALDSQGRLLVAGSDQGGTFLTRLVGGSPDRAFASSRSRAKRGGNTSVQGVLRYGSPCDLASQGIEIQPDGSMLLSGASNADCSTPVAAVTKVTAGGMLDQSFGVAGIMSYPLAEGGAGYALGTKSYAGGSISEVMARSDTQIHLFRIDPSGAVNTVNSEGVGSWSPAVNGLFTPLDYVNLSFVFDPTNAAKGAMYVAGGQQQGLMVREMRGFQLPPGVQP